MQSAKKKINHNTDSGGSSGQQQEHLGKQKERHIVSWSQEEDDILREQINIHGTESWSTIAARFKDKTTRQCRRRWYTYLNSDFKKGGWSPEEDLLLCEAQKVFGNRWTEIAKVVSGRTDNAVKNRFSTLCKKRAKREALAKENNTSFINLNNKRVIFPTSQNADGLSEGGEPLKKIRRTHLPSTTENLRHIVGERGSSTLTLRQPFAVLAQDKKNGGSLSDEKCVNNIKEAPVDGTSKNKETFIKKDDPKVLALLQQAELLSSLAAKVNSDNTEQSLENAWKDLQDFLHQSKESDELCLSVSDMDYHLETIKDLIEDLQGSDGCSLSSWRQPDLYEETTSGSPQYSTGSTPQNLVACDKADQSHPELHVPILSVEPEIQSIPVDNHGIIEGENHMPVVEPSSAQEKTPPVDDDLKANDLAACSSSNAEFNSPIQETPVFKSLAAAIPSPKFSESERNFLLKALGRDSASCFINPSAHLSQPPACKRALLRSL